MISANITIAVLITVLSWSAAACAGEPPAGESQTTPEQAALFGEGVISTELPEFATSFSPDGATVFFNISNAERSVLHIASSTNVNGSWSTPAPLPFSDSAYFDVDPFVSPDGRRVYFSSNRPVDGDEPKDFDTWYVERQGDEWSDPINPGAPLNGPESEVFFSMTTSGTTYFSISTDGIRKIYRSAYTESGYQPPEPIRLDVPDSVGAGNPLIAPDGRFLLFTSAQLPGMGSADIFVADRQPDGSFGNVRGLTSGVNTPYADFAPGFGPDGRYLYFTSERPGIVDPIEEGRPPGDLYRVSLEVAMQ